MNLREDYTKARQVGEMTPSVYHEERLQTILNGESLLDYLNEAGFVLHVYPDGVFETEDYYHIDVGDFQRGEPIVPTNPYSGAGRGNSVGRTATGRAVLRTTSNGDETLVGRYAHASAVGIIEAVSGSISSGHGRIDGEQLSASSWEAMIVSSVNSYAELLENQGLSGPFEIHLSMFNMEDVAFVYEEGHMFGGPERFQSDDVTPFPVSVSSQDSDVDMRDELAPLLESVWRAAGYDDVHTLDQEGDWELEGDY